MERDSSAFQIQTISAAVNCTLAAHIRYLGQVANLCTEHTEFIRRLLIQEMIARACKHALRQIIEVPLCVVRVRLCVINDKQERHPSNRGTEGCRGPPPRQGC